MFTIFSSARKSFPNSLTVILLSLALGSVWACADSALPTSPEVSPVPPESGETTALGTLESAAQESTLRLEVELSDVGGMWFAREVEVETQLDRGKNERIETHVISAHPLNGTLRLLVGGLEIQLAETTRFELRDGGEISRDTFFERIQVALDSGTEPGVELLRPAPSDPQDPYDSEFQPLVVRLDPYSDDQTFELNVDRRHLAVAGSSVGTLTLLGTVIGIDTDNGSVIEERAAEEAGAGEIKGIVASADPGAGTAELMDGTILRFVEGTSIKTDGGDGDPDTLDEVAIALAEGLTIEVEAEGVLESGTTYVAVEVEFQIAEEDGEFEGKVVSVDLEAGTFTLANKRVYTVGEETVFDEAGDLLSLEAMAGALDAGDNATVMGQATKDELGAWLVSTVLVEVNGEDGEFEGRVDSIDLENGTFTLKNKRTYTVGEGTTFDETGTLLSLEAMAGALDAGDKVKVMGQATKDELGAWLVATVRAEVNGG